MILAHYRGFCIGYGIQLFMVVKLQIITFPFENKTEDVVDKIIPLRPQLIKPRIHISQEDNNLDVCVSG